MFILIVSSLVFVFGSIWQYSSFEIRRSLNFSLPLLLSFLFTAFYFNGDDWVNYYYPLHEKSINPYLIYEPFFVLYFLIIQNIFQNNFGYSMLFYYFLTFSIFTAVLLKLKLNPYIFFSFLIITIGNTLVLEQIRQLIASAFIIWSFYFFSKEKFKHAIFFLFLAIFSHVASVIMLVVYTIIFIRGKNKFVIVTLFIGAVFTALIYNLFYILSYFTWIGFISVKLISYVESFEVTSALGYFAILDFIFIFYFLVKYKENDPSKIKLMRIIFTGAVFQFVFNFFPVMLRFISFHYVFIAILLSLEFSKILSSLKIKREIYPIFLSVTFIVFAFSSYYRNPLHPIDFLNFNLSGWDILFGKYDFSAMADFKISTFSEAN
ncbi:MAG: EpsG family protein [Glaciimonas sp.]|nr:EpsG family protein [Glaciimonas sp.]